MIEKGLLRKKECEAKALAIVERLIEADIDKEWFRESAFSINGSHYNDVIDERTCVGLCGYPLCSQQLENVLKQQYKISMATNKVYDITERKKFCSACCYKKSTFFKEQLLSSPLWLREEGDKKPVIFYEEAETVSANSIGEEKKFEKT